MVGGAVTADAGQRVINRYHHAVEYTLRLKEIGKNEMYPLTSCPKEFSLGYRYGLTVRHTCCPFQDCQDRS